MRGLPAFAAGLLTSLCLSSVAFAQDQEPEPRPTTRAQPPAEQKPEWGTEPFIRPAVGASVFAGSNGETYTAIALGAQGGLRVFQKKDGFRWQGVTRALGQVIVGAPSTFGYEFRLGAFAGPWYEVVGLRTGPDFFYSKFTYDIYELDATTGIGWPVIALFDVGVFNAHGGFEPSFFFNPDRPRVDWGDEPAFGFGHEYAWLAGVGIDVKVLSISLNYTDRITAYGHQKGIGVGFRIGG